MKCNCKWGESALAVIILVWTIWPNLIGLRSYWVIIVAAALLLIHAWMNHHSHGGMGMPQVSAPRSSRRRRRRR